MPDTTTWYVGVKGHQKTGVWKAVHEDDTEARTRSSVGFNTVLSLNFRFSPDNDPPEGTLYRGPFYIDLDVEESLAAAIRAAKSVVKTLKSNGVREDDLRIWLSGKKGFHIVVPSQVFNPEGADGVEHLPQIYKFMASDLKLPKDAMDYSVYSGGRGRMWRVAGVKRTDNGKFKVPITVQELEELTVDGYAELTSTAREELPAPTSPAYASAMNALYKRAVARQKSQPALTKRFVDPEIRNALDGELPPCGKLMLAGEVNTDLGFNQASIQFAKVIASFAPWKNKELIEEFAANTTGTNYNTEAKRKKHTAIAFRTATNPNSGYGWSCRSACSVLKEHPCFDCPVNHLAIEDDDDSIPEKEPTKAQEKEPTKVQEKVVPVEDDLYNSQGLVATDEGYAFVGEKGVLRQVSNFTLKPENYYVEFIPAVAADRRTATMFGVYISNKKIGTAILEEESWNSRMGFLKSFYGLSNAAFYGKDDDIQKMREVIVKNLESNAGKIRRVAATGIHCETVAENQILTWVEPGYSLNNFGMEGTYTLQGKGKDFQPELHKLQSSKITSKEILPMLTSMVKVNEPLAASQMVAWYLACHLKTHLSLYHKTFPLLAVSGNAGSGKTQGNELLATIIHGSPYHKSASVVSLPGASPFALWSACASSMTTPIILDEYNRAGIGKTKYTEVGELMKLGFQRGSILKGTLAHGTHDKSAHGANLVEYPLTSPMAVISEQPINSPALVQRSVMVSLTPSSLKTSGVREAFARLRTNWELANQFAKLLTLEALHLQPSVVYDWYKRCKSQVPIDIGDRPQICYATILTGLKFLEYVGIKHEWGLEEVIKDLFTPLFEQLKPEGEVVEQLIRSTNRSEVDAVMETFVSLAASAVDDRANFKLEKDIHYVVKGDSLYLHPTLCFLEYIKYVSQVERRDPPINNISAFRTLLRNEPYCESVQALQQGFALGKPVFKLSLPALRDKGLDVDMFVP